MTKEMIVKEETKYCIGEFECPICNCKIARKKVMPTIIVYTCQDCGRPYVRKNPEWKEGLSSK